jgi:hypothetical protein
METISKNIKKILNEENQTKIIGLLTILISLWLVLYFIPELFATLFNTLLGNLILILASILTFSYNLRTGAILSLILILLYRFSALVNVESFTDSSLQDFLLIQNTINRQKIFDTDILQTQASQEELDYFNSHGMWPWSQSTTDLYVNATNSNPYIRTYSKDAINYARSIYNEASILELLSNQTNEGLFKINGVQVPNPQGNPKEQLPNGFGDFAYNSGILDDRRNDIIKCNLDTNELERTRYNGKGGIFGEQLKSVTSVDYNNLEDIVPGFSFINEPCNPCSSASGSSSASDNKCKFKLNVKPSKLF